MLEDKWEQINQAGCIFWRNVETGECTSMAPKTSFAVGKVRFEWELGLGSGLVYLDGTHKQLR